MIALDIDELNNSNSWYLHRDDETRVDELIRIFKSRMSPLELETRVVTNASARDLRRVLKSPLTTAVFWVGHATSGDANSALSLNNIVVDYYGVNVADLFKDIHSNVRWIGLVGCNTKGIVQENKKLGFYRFNPLLHIDSFDSYAVASRDLNSSASQAYLYLATIKRRYPKPICDWQQKVSSSTLLGQLLKIEREDSEQRSNIRISINEVLLGFLSKEDDQALLWIPNGLNIEKIEVVQMELEADTPALEALRITNENRDLVWSPISRQDGTRWGKTRNLYINSSIAISNGTTIKPSNCYED